MINFFAYLPLIDDKFFSSIDVSVFVLFFISFFM